MKRNGFSLIELMITVAIVAILAAIAIPSYSAFTRRSNRTDATRTLTFDAQALERCYSQAFTYAGCAGVPAANTPTPTPQGYYSVTIQTTATPASFTITATATAAPQTADTDCASFTVDSTGAQSAKNSSNAANTQTCWGST
jgi:type IV pilus assembly protein PilE